MHHKILNWDVKKDQKLVSDELLAHNIVLCSTDTIWGLLANISLEGLEKLNALKGERGQKPYLLLISGPDKIDHFVDKSTIDTHIINLLAKCWPGPVTIIFRARKDIPMHLRSQENTIALRCPQHHGLQTILHDFPALFSTSANISNAPSPKNFSQIQAEIINNVSIIIGDQTEHNGTGHQAIPSTIIDCSIPGNVHVVRTGALAITTLEEYYGKPFTQ